ncbi:MAG: YraN family protein [Candidatus Edwardsbacteria bacterium]|jgi:putative endonuclease|nr:YraN family protein [Candidatus Edwardsbacteria bacterium]
MSGTGEYGEQLAVRHLEQQGYRVVERNWRAGKAGEIDIVAYDGPVLAFVEVKTRSGGPGGGPQRAVTPRKQAQLARLATRYLYRTGLYGTVDCRFDVVAIELSSPRPRIELIRDAFRPR